MKNSFSIHCTRYDGKWLVTCADMPGLFLSHESLDACLHDFVPAVKKLVEVKAKINVGPKADAR